MSTNISNPNAYCTAAQFLAYVDIRVAGDCFNDDGTRATSSQITTPATPQNNIFLAHAGMAAGWIEAACLRGDRYLPADLASTLQGNSLQLLVWMNSILCLKSLFERRTGKRMPDEYKANVDNALALLEELADGTRIFALQEAADAGVQEHYVEQPQDVVARDLTTYQMKRFFGRRSNRRSWAKHS